MHAISTTLSMYRETYKLAEETKAKFRSEVKDNWIYAKRIPLADNMMQVHVMSNFD